MKAFLTQFSKHSSIEKYILGGLLAIGLFFFLLGNLFLSFGEQQFWVLAQSFLEGRMDIGKGVTSADGSYYQGLTYWPQGIFPALLLIPFVFFFDFFIHQGHLQFFLNLFNLFLAYKIAFKITKNKISSLWLAFAYFFATVYLVVGFIPWSWWYAQVVATTCLFLLLNEYLHQRRWLLMGIFVACAMATRIDLLLAAFFPLFLLFLSKEKRKISHLFLFFLPIFCVGALIALYNEIRFGSFLEFGYRYHQAAIGTAQQMLERYGVWNFMYYPTNFFYLFLQGVEGVFIENTAYVGYPFLTPNPWGMSILLTSPILLWVVKTKWRSKIVRAALLTVTLILLFLLGYFGIGARQYGYRYALDFQPFLFLLLCFTFRKRMGLFPKIVIVLSFLFNLFLFSGIFTQSVS